MLQLVSFVGVGVFIAIFWSQDWFGLPWWACILIIFGFMVVWANIVTKVLWGKRYDGSDYLDSSDWLDKIDSDLDLDDSTPQDHLTELLDSLEEIADMKEELPLSQRGWCSVLGLYVQGKKSIRPNSMEIKIQAGGKLHSNIDALKTIRVSEESGFDDWKVKKYEQGDWEKLVDPTLELVYWLHSTGGLHEDDEEDLNRAVEVFKETGILELPK